jgi:hypothetical protein
MRIGLKAHFVSSESALAMMLGREYASDITSSSTLAPQWAGRRPGIGIRCAIIDNTYMVDTSLEHGPPISDRQHESDFPARSAALRLNPRSRRSRCFEFS